MKNNQPQEAKPGEADPSKNREMPKVILWTIIAVLVLGGAFLVWQTQFRQPADSVNTVPDTASLELVNQVTDSEKVLVQRAALTESGFLVVHKDDDGVPGEIIGNSRFLRAGFHDSVLISVQGLDFGNNTLHVMIHTDSDGNEKFNPAIDVPFVQEGEIVVESLELDFQPNREGSKG